MSIAMTADSGLFQNLPLIEWGLRHAADLSRVATDFSALTSSADLTAKGTALKDVIDVVIADLGDFPGFSSAAPAPVNPPAPVGPVGPAQASVLVSVSSADRLAAIQGHMTAIGDGQIINAVVNLVTNPQFVQLLTTIIGLFSVAK